jgi:hypothetical protein
VTASRPKAAARTIPNNLALSIFHIHHRLLVQVSHFTHQQTLCEAQSSLLLITVLLLLEWPLPARIYALPAPKPYLTCSSLELASEFCSWLLAEPCSLRSSSLSYLKFSLWSTVHRRMVFRSDKLSSTSSSPRRCSAWSLQSPVGSFLYLPALRRKSWAEWTPLAQSSAFYSSAGNVPVQSRPACRLDDIVEASHWPRFDVVRRRRRCPIRQLDAPLGVAIRPHAYPRRNHCDWHSQASIASGSSERRCEIIVSLPDEKQRSHSADIAGIDSASKANCANSGQMRSLLFQNRTYSPRLSSLLSWRLIGSSLQYCS